MRFYLNNIRQKIFHSFFERILKTEILLSYVV